MRFFPVLFASLLAAGTATPAAAQEAWASFDSRGLPRSEGARVRLQHPPGWKRVAPSDAMALAEWEGTQGELTSVLQVARGRPQTDMEALCRPERARTLLQDIAGHEPGTRMTDVVARKVQGRPAYELRYERHVPPDHLLARSLIVCLQSTRLLVTCGVSGPLKNALVEAEPVCRQVLESLEVEE